MVHRTGFVDLYSKWLFFIIILFLFAPHNIPLGNKIIFILLFFILFYPMFFIKDRYTSKSLLNIPSTVGNSHLIVLLILQLFLGEYASRYYTGTGLFEALSQLIKGTNNYSLYQSYFSENNLNEFGIKKLPAIFAAAFLKGVFLYSISILVIYKDNSKPKYFLFLSIVPLVLFAISRGTFFEIFEIAFCVLYFYKISNKKILNPLKAKSIKKNIYLLSVGASLAAAFSYNASRRYEDVSALINSECLLEEMCFTPYTSFVSIEHIVYLLSGYFAAGMYFVTEYVNLLLEGKVLSSMLPFATTKLFSSTEIGLVDDLCENYMYCSVSWQPELFSWFSFFGFIFALLIFSLFFYIIFKIEKKLLDNLNLYSLPLLYLLLIYILSIPVGRFYTVSSSNILCTIFFLIFWFFKTPKKLFRYF